MSKNSYYAALGTAAVLSAVASSASAAVGPIVVDNFESYASTAAMEAVWAPSAAGASTLNTTGGNPGQYALHNAGASVNQRSFTAVNATATESLVLSADIYDDGTSANKRETVGLRNSNSSNIIELGMYNSPAGYVFRTVLFPGTSDGYVTFKNATGGEIAQRAGWHRFGATITTTGILFTLDLGADGTIDSSFQSSVVASAAGYNNLRFGGPSAVSSPGGGAGFDNISFQSVAVPEPTTLAGLAGLGGLAIARRRKAR